MDVSIWLWSQCVLHCDLLFASRLGLDLEHGPCEANQLLKQINRISAHVDYLGQKYDLAKIKLDKIASEITNTKADVKVIKKNVAKGTRSCAPKRSSPTSPTARRRATIPLLQQRLEDRCDQRLQPVGPGNVARPSRT